MNKRFNSILRLRRDYDYNYEKIQTTFVPANGEICLVDTKEGLRVICGDGVSTFENLSFIDTLLVKGYYFNEDFYKTSEYTESLTRSTQKMYFDINSGLIYLWDGSKYQSLINHIPQATDKQPGIVTLHQTVGNSETGAMSQKAITDLLNNKIEILIHEGEETVEFGYNLFKQ